MSVKSTRLVEAAAVTYGTTVPPSEEDGQPLPAWAEQDLQLIRSRMATAFKSDPAFERLFSDPSPDHPHHPILEQMAQGTFRK